MDRITRKDLKSDKFALEVEHTVGFLSHHRKESVRYGIVAVAAVALVVGIFAFRSYQHRSRQAALNAALEIMRAPVGPPVDEFTRSFPTAQEKDSVLVKAFTDLATKHAGSDEGYIAEYYLGTAAAERGQALEAGKWLQDVAANAPANYASLAKLSLADLYRSQGKVSEGEKLLRELMAKPTDFVSKEQATIALGQLLIPSNPAEARKLLDPLRGSRTAIAQAAIGAAAELGPVVRK